MHKYTAAAMMEHAVQDPSREEHHGNSEENGKKEKGGATEAILLFTDFTKC